MIILREKYYSDLTLEQKEYGIKDIINKLSKNTRKGVSKVVSKISESKKKQYKKADNMYEEFENSLPENRDLGRKLIREADKREVKVVDEDKFNFFTGNEGDFLSNTTEQSIKNAKEYLDYIDSIDNRDYKREARKVMRKILTGKPIISLSKKYKNSYNTLAHELGHKISRDSEKGGKIARLSDSISDDGSVLDSIKKRNLLIKNEKNANKEGEKLLKDLGASRKDLRNYRKSRKLALRTYKLGETSKIFDKISGSISPDEKRKLRVTFINNKKQ